MGQGAPGRKGGQRSWGQVSIWPGGGTGGCSLHRLEYRLRGLLLYRPSVEAEAGPNENARQDESDAYRPLKTDRAVVRPEHLVQTALHAIADHEEANKFPVAALETLIGQ